MGRWQDNDYPQTLSIGFSAAMAGLLLFALISLVVFILLRGTSYFWPQNIYQLEYHAQANHSSTSGRFKAFANLDYSELVAGQKRLWFQVSSAAQPTRSQLMLKDSHVFNTELVTDVAAMTLHDGRVILARPMYLSGLTAKHRSMAEFRQVYASLADLQQRIEHIRGKELARIHQQLAGLNQRQAADNAVARLKLHDDYRHWQKQVDKLTQQVGAFRLHVQFADGQSRSLALAKVALIDYPNAMTSLHKINAALIKFARFLLQAPQQGNSAGGIFPALFGTVLLVLLMTLLVTPLGVLAAIYLTEYARDNWVTALIRISVNNMAGVPSVVYGVFGLGVFVYMLGGSIDSLFFAERLPSPTFGTPGVLWAAITMAMLTLPVVIVATEEGLKRVPSALRLGSYALGATKAETIRRTVLPMASPGIMTGVILAIARAAGEVAPLMLVGAVKFAPALPIDAEFPFVHLQRQFMHLGALIYDGAFHSQTYSKGSSMIFAACSLLLLLVFLLNLLAMVMRNKLQRNYRQL